MHDKSRLVSWRLLGSSKPRDSSSSPCVNSLALRQSVRKLVRCCAPDVSLSSFEPTLSVRSALLAFHKAHYSANRMSLAVLGRESLDALESLVAPLFAAVANHALPRPRWPHPPYPDRGGAFVGQYFRVAPVKSDSSLLTVTWALPSIREQYLSKPYHSS